MPRSRRALTTMDGVIGSPTVLLWVAGRVQAGAAWRRRPTDHMASRAAHGATATSGPHTMLTNTTAQRIRSITVMIGVTTSVMSFSAMASTTPSPSSPPAVAPVPTAAFFATRIGEVSRSIRR